MSILNIDQITLYTGLCEKGDDCYQAYKFLKDKGIDFSNLHYGYPDHHEGAHAALSTWTWHDGSTHNFQEFPYVTWREVDSNFEINMHYAYGLEDIKTCSLFADLEKVVKIKV